METQIKIWMDCEIQPFILKQKRWKLLENLFETQTHSHLGQTRTDSSITSWTKIHRPAGINCQNLTGGTLGRYNWVLLKNSHNYLEEDYLNHSKFIVMGFSIFSILIFPYFIWIWFISPFTKDMCIWVNFFQLKSLMAFSQIR